MPVMQKLADNGVMYSQWHTTALCSPTRSCFFLTGRNHHVNRFSAITEASTGFPGSAARLPAQCAPVPSGAPGQRLQHVLDRQEPQRARRRTSPAAAASRSGRCRWASTGSTGSSAGETNQWFPIWSRTTGSSSSPYGPDEGYHLSKDLADNAIRMLRDQNSSNPSKPWFMWFCPGANHAPAPRSAGIHRQVQGQVDDGYEAYREWVLPRMIEKGVLPEGTKMTPINPLPEDIAVANDDVRPWNTLNAEEKELFSKMAEVYAGFSEYTDAQVGRIIDYLEKTGQLENTIVFYCADNGASGEGSPNGSVNENKFFNGYPDELSENMKYLNTLGSRTPTTTTRPAGRWLFHPFQMFKRVQPVRRGTCDPMVISWPKGIKAKGEVRSQYHHATDVAATVLDVAGLEMPGSTTASSSTRSTGCRCGTASTTRRRPPRANSSTTRCWAPGGIWKDGWKAAALHAPISGRGHFDQDRWELTTSRRTVRSRPTSPTSNPTSSKSSSMPGSWRPRTISYCPSMTGPPPKYLPARGPRPSRRGPATSTTTSRHRTGARRRRGRIQGRSYKVIANVELAEDPQGVIFAHGSRFGGHTLFIRTDGCTMSTTSSVSNLEQDFASPAADPRQRALSGHGVRATKAGQFQRRTPGDDNSLRRRQEAVATGPMRAQIFAGKFTLSVTDSALPGGL